LPGDASRGSMRGVGRVGVALDMSCGFAADRSGCAREGSVYRRRRPENTQRGRYLPAARRTFAGRLEGCERCASRELLSTHHHGRRRKTTTVRCRRRLTTTHPGDSPPRDNNETEGPFTKVRRVARLRAHRLFRFPASERGPLLPLPRDLRLDVIPLRHHDGLAAHGAARCDLGVSRLGPNGLKITKETTHDLV